MTPPVCAAGGQPCTTLGHICSVSVQCLVMFILESYFDVFTMGRSRWLTVLYHVSVETDPSETEVVNHSIKHSEKYLASTTR